MRDQWRVWVDHRTVYIVGDTSPMLLVGTGWTRWSLWRLTRQASRKAAEWNRREALARRSMTEGMLGGRGYGDT